MVMCRDRLVSLTGDSNPSAVLPLDEALSLAFLQINAPLCSAPRLRGLPSMEEVSAGRAPSSRLASEPPGPITPGRGSPGQCFAERACFRAPPPAHGASALYSAAIPPRADTRGAPDDRRDWSAHSSVCGLAGRSVGQTPTPAHFPTTSGSVWRGQAAVRQWLAFGPCAAACGAGVRAWGGRCAWQAVTRICRPCQPPVLSACRMHDRWSAPVTASVTCVGTEPRKK